MTKNMMARSNAVCYIPIQFRHFRLFFKGNFKSTCILQKHSSTPVSAILNHVQCNLISPGWKSRYFTCNTKLAYKAKKRHITDTNSTKLIAPFSNVFTFYPTPETVTLNEVPFCYRNENRSKKLIRKLYEFTSNKFKISIKSVTKKVMKIFSIKGQKILPLI